MSTLREIMQRLAEVDSKRTKGNQADFSELLKCHVDEYQSKLETCTPAMLQYEWTWLLEHIEALELCLAQPTMCHQLGGLTRVESLVEESKQFQIALEEMFHQRMIHPARSPHPVNPVEHAWEVSEDRIKQAWGIN